MRGRCGSLTAVRGSGCNHFFASITACWQSSGLSLLIGLGIVSAFGWPQSSCAQSGQEIYPSKPIVLSVGFSAGSTSDSTAREMARQLTESLGQQVVVVNREGAASAISIGTVAKAKPDGYTLLWATGGGLCVAPAYESRI